MGSTRKAIRVGLLFGGMAVSLATLPALLTKLDSVRQDAMTGGGTGAEGVSIDTDALLGAHAEKLRAPDAREVLEARHTGAKKPKPVTRVLGPDD